MKNSKFECGEIFARYQSLNIATTKRVIPWPMRRAELPVSQLYHLLLYVYYLRSLRTLRKASRFPLYIYILYVRSMCCPFSLFFFSYPLSPFSVTFPFPFLCYIYTYYIYIYYLLKYVLLSPFPYSPVICTYICTYFVLK